MEENKRHHFIPRCYLRFFSANGKFVNVYSKKNKRNNSAQAISKTACEDCYYRIPERFVTNLNNKVFDPDFFEKEFFANNIEKLFGPILKTINCAAESWKINKSDNEVLKKSEREIFAALIAIQYLRMPNIRDLLWSFYKKHSVERLDIIKSSFASQSLKDKEYIESIRINFDDHYKSANHSEIFSNQKIINNFQDHILNKVWIFYVNEHDNFYTSDNPILLKPHVEYQPFFYEGFAMKGVEIIYPVSSSVILTLWDNEYFQKKSYQDNSFRGIDEKSIRQYNCYQYIWSNDEVYSKRNDFKLIEIFKYANGGNDIFKKRPSILVNGK